ncbi:MAG: glycosyl transferase family 36 [Candidatus Glassbacteria bacterium]|nr:glycosyl transferase family 36 [Candidatus Glassbacteria bacterium]
MDDLLDYMKDRGVPMQLAKGKYGYFDEDTREYVITRPDPPQPWYNYLVNDLGYCALISHTGGGTSFHLSPRDRKVLRYRFNGVPPDRPGRYLYLRDMDSGDYWSATWAPVMKPLEQLEYRCRVGQNVQTISTVYRGILAEITYFVLPDRPAEVWLVRLENKGESLRRLNSYSYAEFNFWGTLRDLLNLDNCPKTSRYYQRDGVIVHNTWNDVGSGLDNMSWVRHYAGFASTVKPAATNIERQLFLGGIYRSEADPLVVETGEDTNFDGVGDWPVCGLTHHWELEPGGRAEFAFVLAVADTEDEMYGHLEAASDLEALRAGLEKIRAGWRARLARLEAKTPAAGDFDPCVNTWNPYNSYMTALLSRSISGYEWGAGRGLGFRDTLQDLMGACHLVPDFVRERLLLMAGLVHADGIAVHNYFPLTDTGDMRDFYDDHLWLPLSVCQYIKETGDTGILDEEVRYWGGPGRQRLIDRLALVLDATWRLRGEHGLPQTGHADWNDGLNPGAMESESLFNTMLFCAAAREVAALADFTGDPELATLCRSRYDEIKRIANQVAWDGAWYRRILLAGGGHIGGKAISPGTIFLEPQAWSVISGVADGSRAITVMDSVNKYLAGEYGIKLLHPPYLDYDPKWGSISICLPGHKENGAIFCHAASWAVVAEALLGRGQQAYDYYMRMAPTTKNRIAGLHEVEPYVYSQHIAQPPYHRPGRARNSWLTGSAGWFMRASSQYILGVRPELAGLLIDPAVPGWREFSVARTFRGARYEINVKNPDGVEKGVKEITVDGRQVEPGVLPPAGPGDTVRVEVVMGR